MIVATAGHVDHGKTSLVNALTGVNTDRLQEEQARGLTIDLGFAYIDAETGGRLGFVDVPGHIKFINNMLAGVSAIDHALLVVAADDGVMPQTIEHLEILNLLGIRTGNIALTKIDRCDETQINQTIEQIQQTTHGTFLQDAEIFPVSATTQEGVETLKIALDVISEEVSQKTNAGLFRLAIDRRFTVRGSGTVVTGSVFSGQINVGDELWLMPQNIAVRVRGLHTQNQEAQFAIAGDRCAINISSNEISLEDISRGNWLTQNQGPSTQRADLSLSILNHELKPFAHWTPVHIHTAANHVTGRIAVLQDSRIQPGESALAQMVLDESINLCVGDRVVIRDQSALRTIGGGVVLDPYSPKRGRTKTERIEYLQKIDPDSIEISFNNLIAHTQTGILIEDIAHQFNLTSEQRDQLRQHDAAKDLGELLIDRDLFTDRKIELTEQLDDWHTENPTKAGLPQNQMQGMARSWPSILLEAVIDELVAESELTRDGNLFNRPGAGIQLTKQEQKIWQSVESILQSEPMKPPVLHELAKTLSLDPKALDKTLGQIAKTGLLVKPVKNRYFLPEAIAMFKKSMHTAAGTENQFTVQQFRDVTGIGRNLCIEVLEYFDRQAVTRRIGDARQIVEK